MTCARITIGIEGIPGLESPGGCLSLLGRRIQACVAGLDANSTLVERTVFHRLKLTEFDYEVLFNFTLSIITNRSANKQTGNFQPSWCAFAGIANCGSSLNLQRCLLMSTKTFVFVAGFGKKISSAKFRCMQFFVECIFQQFTVDNMSRGVLKCFRKFPRFVVQN